MKVQDIMVEIMTNKGLRYSILAARLGLAPNAMRERMLLKRPSLSKISETLRVMDYKIQIVPRETRTPKGGYEVEYDEI